ncbi:hypothetical protein LNB28_14055 [Methylocystis sp. SB2]|nr:hypothetical protein [Methylocystis sp. SB2]ULO23252.1 hypothetical protein LNB28_14055 [Methylocystis sp. SB2]
MTGPPLKRSDDQQCHGRERTAVGAFNSATGEFIRGRRRSSATGASGIALGNGATAGPGANAIAIGTGRCVAWLCRDRRWRPGGHKVGAEHSFDGSRHQR